MNLASTYLFVPADRPERVVKAIAAGSMAVIIDLEDAVAVFNKGAARASLKEHWRAYEAQALLLGVTLLVRINPADTAWHREDLSLAATLAIGHLVVPKAESVPSLESVRAVVPEALLYPLMETALGFHVIHEVARVPGVARLILGAVDLMLDLGIRSDDVPLHPYRALIVLASRVAGLPPPIDGVCLALDAPEVLASEVARARDFGFAAKLLIHPKQVSPSMAAFQPCEAEIALARSVVAASAAANGAAVAVNGKMVDLPVLLAAQRLLATIR